MNITIKSAEIKNSLFLKYNFEQTSGKTRNVGNLTSDAPIHDDLRNAFRALIPHFTFICEEITDEKLVRNAIEKPDSYLSDIENCIDESFFKYRVYAFSVKGKDEAKLIQIKGSKRLTTGKSIGLETPEEFVFNSDYKFNLEFQEAIARLEDEVIAYIDGKQAPVMQTEMFAGDQEAEEEEE